MAKTLANYDPLVQIPSGMTPAGADFPIVESHDILVGENDKRLDAKLDDIDNAIGNVGETPIATQLSSKVNTGDIVTSVAATGSTSNNKIPSETAVRAAIEAKTINVDSTVTEGSTNAVSGGAVHTQLATKQDVLTFDTTPTASSGNPVTSGGVKAALDTKQNALTFDTTPTASSNNPVTSGGVKAALDTKQDALTFDTTPTASSSNPVTSGGVKAALDNKQNTLTYETTPIVGSVNPVTSTGIRNAIDAAAAGNLGQMQAAYDTFSANISARVSSLSNGMVACSNIAAETTVGDTRILLYTGTTNSIYTNGHWYYNSAPSNAAPSWTDGGAVGSAPTIDNTLTVEGAAANSKAVGDAIENIVTISNTQPGSNSGNKVWIKETTSEEVQVPTYAEHIAKANKADIATNNESDNGSGTITASKAYAIGDHFYINNTNTSSENFGVSTLYKATAAIASGSAIVVGTNCEASKIVDDIALLSSNINTLNESLENVRANLADKIDASGISQVTPQNLQIVDAEISPNLLDTNSIIDDKYIDKNGTENESSSMFVSGYIPVTAGEKYVYTHKYQNNREDAQMRFVACYDADKQIMKSSGSNSKVDQPYTVPEGVSYIRVSTYKSADYSDYQFEQGEAGTVYYPYGTLISAVIKNQYLPVEDVDMADIPAFHLVEGQNLINKDDADYLSGKYINAGGHSNNNGAYITSGYIKVSAGDMVFGSYIAGSGKTEPATLSYIACYDVNKSVLPLLGKNANTTPYFEVPETVEYVRVSIRIASYTQYLQIEKTNSNLPKPYKPYESPHYELLDSHTPQGEPPLHVYLPPDIYVAVGRTIELYNEQVCIDHEKYHFRWVCAEGSAYARKFSITGTTAKNLNLDLYLYDDNKNICWCGRCVIHVVAVSNSTKKILPIGDSLTNWKAWLQETMLLSGNHISWLGTRYSGQSVDSEGNVYASGTIHHEGRSGWSASNYLTNSEYTFDNRYDGVSSVSGSANPFWNGSAFSLNYYLTTQTGVDTPDAVQIFLGTNDIRNGVESATANIVSMVQTIRAEYPDMPIFICNTIYNANQNGYGSVGSDAYSASAGASTWQYNQDCLVMDLMISLKKALTSITGIYIIPLAICMDREYNFGQIMTKVNPRSNLEIPMPVERIHPQASGYYQMADLMYSTYCGVL